MGNLFKNTSLIQVFFKPPLMVLLVILKSNAFVILLSLPFTILRVNGPLICCNSQS